MAFSIRKLAKRFFLFFNTGWIALFLLACLQPHLHPARFWYLGYLSILFPYIAVGVAAFIIFWLFTSPRWALLSIVALGLGYGQLKLLGGTTRTPFALEQSPGSIRVMSWNVMGLRGFESGRKVQEANADSIFTLVKQYQPDIICLQEFGEYQERKWGRSYVNILKELGYNHEVLSRDYSRKRFAYSSGVAIFSKYPLLYTRRLLYNSSAESLLQANVLVGDDTVTIFNTHLQSYRFAPEELEQVEKIKQTDKPDYNTSSGLLQKMKRSFRNRAAEVDQALPLMDSVTHPSILCLDMNEVPNSYAYNQLSKGRKDAFLEKGWGLGRTYAKLLPTLRIDYILPDTSFEVLQAAVLPYHLSDHYPVIADLRMLP